MASDYEKNYLLSEDIYYKTLEIVMRKKYDLERDLLKAARTDIIEDKKILGADMSYEENAHSVKNSIAYKPSTKALDQFIDKNFLNAENKATIKAQMLDEYHRLKFNINKARVAGIGNNYTDMALNGLGMLARTAAVGLALVESQAAFRIGREAIKNTLATEESYSTGLDGALAFGLGSLAKELIRQGFKVNSEINESLANIKGVTVGHQNANKADKSK